MKTHGLWDGALEGGMHGDAGVSLKAYEVADSLGWGSGKVEALYSGSRCLQPKNTNKKGGIVCWP